MRFYMSYLVVPDKRELTRNLDLKERKKQEAGVIFVIFTHIGA